MQGGALVTPHDGSKKAAMERRSRAAEVLAAAGVDCLVGVIDLPGGAFAALARVRGKEYDAARIALRREGAPCGLVIDDAALNDAERAACYEGTRLQRLAEYHDTEHDDR
jgi:hypothetical protein